MTCKHNRLSILSADAENGVSKSREGGKANYGYMVSFSYENRQNPFLTRKNR